jgi:hypothetical protein
MADKGDQERIERHDDDKVKNPPDYAHLGGQKVKRLVAEGKEKEEERAEKKSQQR